jgi:hypothetical protein
MSDFGYGANRAIGEIVGGFVSSVIVNAFVASGLLPSSYVILFAFLNIVGLTGLIFAMPVWGLTYLFGWMFGVYLMLQTGLVGILEAFLYLGVPVVVLVIRLVMWIRD